MEKHLLENYDDGILVFITCKPSTVFSSKLITDFDNARVYLREDNTQVDFVTNADTTNKRYVIDKNNSISSHVENLDGAKEVGENILILKKSGNEIKLLEHLESPNPDENWAEVVVQFVKNYYDEDPDVGLLWRWGQLVQEEGKYNCVECDHQEFMQLDQLFPVCSVCLSGEIDGPSGPGDGFWELD